MRNMDDYRYELGRDEQDRLVTLHVMDRTQPMESQHFHDSTEFIYVASGCVHASLGSARVEVPSGHLLALSSFLPHDCPREDAELWQLIVPRSLVGNLDRLMGNRTFDRHVIADPDGQLLRYMRLIYELNTREGIFASMDEAYAKNAAISAAANFVRVVIPLCGLREESGSSMTVMQAIRYLSQHFREPIRIGEMAQRLYCNRSQLSAAFRETFGMSMNEYVTRLRAAEVRRLLSENPEITLPEAGAEAGFGSLRTLHRAYKEIYGCAPCEGVEK